ncbi:unnamed protein product [Cercopithifilaria johnstoni]|uniref:Serpin domain-containing protein n=1 Tax=Cercopithifilaria johnstoni TaxID=2874296 RepID=A0A8J2Q8D7_9BILA|nr:unnamed protein product [Cercopithifilaria johnstoni]
MKLIEVILIVGIVLIGTCYCPRPPIPSFCKDEKFRAVVTKMKFNFALKLLRQSSPPNESSLLSPFAIINMLSMLHNVVGDEIQLQMKAVIAGVDESFLKQHTPISQSCQCYVTDILKQNVIFNENRYMERLSKLWVQENITLTSDFTNVLTSDHYVEIGRAYLSPQNVTNFAQEVITWMEEDPDYETRNIIFLNFNFMIYLASKFHIEAEWKYPFLPLSHSIFFNVSPSEAVTVPMMGMSAYFPYYEDDNVQVVSIPFENGKLQMAIILPKEMCGLQEFEMELTGELLISYIDALRTSVEVVVLIPKFAYIKYFALSNALENMGMKSIFNQSANFSRITDHTLGIAHPMINLAAIEINERGITNISSTFGATIDEDFNRNQPNVRADHPFLYIIFDNQKNIQWIGRFTAQERILNKRGNSIKRKRSCKSGKCHNTVQRKLLF